MDRKLLAAEEDHRHYTWYSLKIDLQWNLWFMIPDATSKHWETKQLEDQGYIKKVREPTDWVNSIVYSRRIYSGSAWTPSQVAKRVLSYALRGVPLQDSWPVAYTSRDLTDTIRERDLCNYLLLHNIAQLHFRERSDDWKWPQAATSHILETTCSSADTSSNDDVKTTTILSQGRIQTWEGVPMDNRLSHVNLHNKESDMKTITANMVNDVAVRPVR